MESKPVVRGFVGRFRCDPDLWDRFETAAKANLSTRSTVTESLVRTFVEDYEASGRGAT